MKGEQFGFCEDGCKTFLYTIKNESGVTANICNFGGVLVNLFIKDKTGKLRDVVLGYDTLAEYEKNSLYFGGLIGRCANRISFGEKIYRKTECD